MDRLARGVVPSGNYARRNFDTLADLNRQLRDKGVLHGVEATGIGVKAATGAAGQ
jgi:hypothetical protein